MKEVRKLWLIFAAALLCGLVGQTTYQKAVFGQSRLSICTSSKEPCPSGGCLPDEVCKVVASSGICGCVPVKPWPYP